jgi:hypothetical protein
MRLKVDFSQCQSHDAQSIHEGAWGIPGRLFDSSRMSLGGRYDQAVALLVPTVV